MSTTYYVTAKDSADNEALWDSKTTQGINVPMSHEEAHELASEIGIESDYRDIRVISEEDYRARMV